MIVPVKNNKMPLYYIIIIGFIIISIPLFLVYGLPEGIQSISAVTLQQHVAYLASDMLAGRETGQPGIQLAEEYIAQAYDSYGLQPIPGDHDFFIDYSLFIYGFDPGQAKLEFFLAETTARPPQTVALAQAGSHFRPLDFSATGAYEAEVIFAGYGITAPEYHYDDYSGINVKDKIVLVLRHEPDNNNPDSVFKGTTYTEHAQYATKAKNALRHGAKGLLLVDDPAYTSHDAAEDFRFERYGELNPLDKDPTLQMKQRVLEQNFLLAFHVSKVIIQQLLDPYRWKLADLQSALDKGTKPSSFPLQGLSAKLHLEKYSPPLEIKARNVGGYLPGTVPALREEWIVVGAHHDHIGSFTGEGDTIFNGADDNASGVSAVLELAQSFSQFNPKPERSMLFITFSGEEMGLFGSRALLEKKLIPVDKVVFMLNLDMIGRNPDKPVAFYHTHTVANMQSFIHDANAAIGLTWQFDSPPDKYMSDYWPFSDRKIPTLFIFTGDHPDYHQVSDHPPKLDYARMEKIARVSFQVLDHLANPENP
jgi:hypothetical protein